MDNLLLLIDGNSLITASYFALPPLYTSTGISTNALKGFVDTVYKLLNDYQPSHMLVAFDSKENKRKEAYPDYKANRRELDEALYSQFEYIERFLKYMHIPMLRKSGYEADDIIASFTIAFNEAMPIIIATRDKDLFRLCCFPSVRIAYSVGSGQLVDSAGVVDMLGVLPEQVGFFKALSGDPSDNVKGVPGIGKVTASKLLNRYGDLDTIVKLAEEEALEPARAGRLIRENMAELNKSFDLVRFITRPINIRIDMLELRIPEINPELDAFFEAMEFSTR